MRLPENLIKHAYFSQNGELAWDKVNTLNVIRWATNSAIATFGIEVWLPTVPGPTIPMPYFYAFECAPGKDEDWPTFVKRANGSAASFVAEFKWDSLDVEHHEKEPYFNLTLGSIPI
jgi:hypothetical protein